MTKDNSEKMLDDRLQRMEQRVERLQEELDVQQRIAFAARLFQGDITASTLLESLAEGVVIVDSFGYIIHTNGRTEEMFDYTKEDIVGRPLSMMLPERYAADHGHHVSSYFRHPHVRPMGLGLDLTGKRKDGSEFPVEISLSHLDTEAGALGLAFITDISLRKQAEQELKLRNQELDEFAHTVAHDLKSTISILVGFAEQLAEVHHIIKQEDLDSYLGQMAVDGRKLINIIDELLLFASIRKEDVKVEPLDMAAIVNAALARLRFQVQEHQAQIKTPDSYPAVLGYSQWVEEVWFNYLSNGLKYGGSPPCLEISFSDQGDKAVKFWVKDNGNGLKPEEQKAIFQSFTRMSDLKIEGYGLGLSIVQRIVEKLDGQVAVESTPGKGSTFSFTLPRAG